MNASIKIELLDNRCMKKIPVGSIGYANESILNKSGMHYSEFDLNGNIEIEFVYRHEVKILGNAGNINA